MIGPGNRLGHAAALAVAESPGEAYNPLFLHGPPGLGKTHLLGAIVEYLRRSRPQFEVHYTTAERFTAEFVSALRRDGPEAFKARYRELDALLIDDVQVLEGKQHTEEEFVHTFNTLYGAGKQIVLSSDRPPEALSRLAERLRDRFSWGLRVELEPPDLRTRLAVVWRIANDSYGEPPDPGVHAGDRLRRAGERAGARGRDDPGDGVRLPAQRAPDARRSSAVRWARAHPVPRCPRPSPRPWRRSRTPFAPPAESGVRTSSPRRARPGSSRPRQIAMYLARQLTSLSLAEIARAFDRDHSTVLHAVRSVSGRLEPGSETAAMIHRIHLTLGSRPVTPDPSTESGHDPPPRGS